MTPQIFWHSVTRKGFWGVCWEGFSPPILLPHWWGHISHAPELWGVLVSAEKCPWSHFGSKGSAMVQKYCPNRWQLIQEEVCLSHHGIYLCNPFLKSVCCSSGPSASPEDSYVLCLQHRFLSLLSPANCPSIWWSSHTSTVSPAHFQICLFSCFGYVLLPKACARPSVVVQVWLYLQSWQILPYISPRLRSLKKIVMKLWDHMVLCLCIHLCISTYFCLAGNCKFAGLL